MVEKYWQLVVTLTVVSELATRLRLKSTDTEHNSEQSKVWRSPASVMKDLDSFPAGWTGSTRCDAYMQYYCGYFVALRDE